MKKWTVNEQIRMDLFEKDMKAVLLCNTITGTGNTKNKWILLDTFHRKQHQWEREWGMMKAKNIHRDILHREPIPVECKYIWKMYNRQVFRLSTDFNFGILRLDSNTAVTIPSLM